MLDMGISAPPSNRPADIIISPLSYQALGTQLWTMGQTALANVSYGAANLMVLYPFWVPEPTTFTKAFFETSTTVAGAVDVGLYDSSGNLLVSSGSVTVVSPGGSMNQTIDITDTTVARGTYYAGMTCNTSGGTMVFFGVTPAAAILQGIGCVQMASATIPLSSSANPATFAAYAQAYLPFFGFQGYRTLGP